MNSAQVFKFIDNFFVGILLCLLAADILSAPHSLRFFGTGNNDIDRVKVSLGSNRINVYDHFTVEFWIKAEPGANRGTATDGPEGWRTGNIIFDRDVHGPGDYGEYGISLSQGKVAFGINVLASGATVIGTRSIDDNSWHHVAVTRLQQLNSSIISIFVDGRLDARGLAPWGFVNYRSNRPTNFPNSDPYLVIGAEKHDLGPRYPSFSGWLDEIRISSVVRYTENFTRPYEPFEDDIDTVALYHLDEGQGMTAWNSVVFDSRHGDLRVGGPSFGPQWTRSTPFADKPQVRLQQIASGLSSPVEITHAGDERLFLVEQGGLIKIWQNNVVLPRPFLDLSNLVAHLGERGLLGLAFDPYYASSGHFFVFYNRRLESAITVARYSVSPDDPNVADPESGIILLTIPTQYTVHNGGKLAFGLDGYLYIAIGDGGEFPMIGNPAQRLDSLFGKLLRIDIYNYDPPYYFVPESNPFANDGSDETLAEIWAYGLRNPWRFSMDYYNGDIFIADVGESRREEVNWQPWWSSGGENYGWPVLEGSQCNRPYYTEDECAGLYAMPPAIEYNHRSDCSITGGFVYRGRRIPALWGYYVYGDFCSGRIFGATRDENYAWFPRELLRAGLGLNISTFGEDVQGELYVADYGRGTIHRIVPLP